MNVSIIGGGNIGMCLAGEISRVKGYEVTLAASVPQQFEDRIRIVDDEKDMIYCSGTFRVTDDMEEAVKDADVILCTYPAHLRPEWIRQIENVTRPEALVGFFPGYGGAEYYCGRLLERGNGIFAVQKVPYVSRTAERGKTARIMSRKDMLLAAAIPSRNTQRVTELLEDMLLMKCLPLDNYLAAALLPGNPLLHTSGSAVYLSDYQAGDTFPDPIYYYRSWNDDCSRLILKLSDEMMDICGGLPLDLSEVQSIEAYYGVEGPEQLTEKFHSIPSFDPLLLPMRQVQGGYVPDFTSRFYREDIPYGICILKALAQTAGLQVPAMDGILEWYRKMTGKVYFLPDGSFGPDIGETAVPQLFGLDSAERIREFYTR